MEDETETRLIKEYVKSIDVKFPIYFHFYELAKKYDQEKWSKKMVDRAMDKVRKKYRKKYDR